MPVGILIILVGAVCTYLYVSKRFNKIDNESIDDKFNYIKNKTEQFNKIEKFENTNRDYKKKIKKVKEFKNDK